MGMLIEDEEQWYPSSLKDVAADTVFRYCNFGSANLVLRCREAIFIGCRFDDLNWQWAGLQACLLVDCHFKSCVFGGFDVSDSRFLDCDFTDCRFGSNDAGTPCRFDGTQWFGGAAATCTGLPAHAFPSRHERRA